jgi:transposase
MSDEQNQIGGREVERAVGERNETAAGRASDLPDPELVERPRRRQYSAEYKLKIIAEAEACTEAGEIGALLRREGIYSSLLSQWRQQREQGGLAALSRPPGRPPAGQLERENAALRARVERAEAELALARKVIAVQGNVSALLGDLLEPRSAPSDESNEE